jgi:hypothetical protein
MTPNPLSLAKIQAGSIITSEQAMNMRIARVILVP